MKIHDLKRLVVPLMHSAHSPKIIDSISRLITILDQLNDNTEVDTQLSSAITPMLNQFWYWVIENLPREKWQAGTEVQPWLELQQELAKIPDREAKKASEAIQDEITQDDRCLDNLESQLEKAKKETKTLKQTIRGIEKQSFFHRRPPSVLTIDTSKEKLEIIKQNLTLAETRVFELEQQIDVVQEAQKQKSAAFSRLRKTKLIAADYHHSILYQALQDQYEQLGSDPLTLSQLLPLLMKCGRLLGYAEKTKLDQYPMNQLSKRISPQEFSKFKEILVLLSAIFYLIFHHVKTEQLQLLPLLIHFRLDTTDEERRSEQAIVNYLFTHVQEMQTFFKDQEHHFDVKPMNELDCLRAVKNILPKSRDALINSVTKDHWLYAFIQQREMPAFENRLQTTVQLLELDFGTYHGEKSYSAAINFADTVMSQTSSLTEEEKKMVSSACYLFCLDKYIKKYATTNADGVLQANSQQTDLEKFRQKLKFFESSENQWLFIFLQQSRYQTIEPIKLVCYTAHLFTIEFNDQDDKSYTAVQKYVAMVRQQYDLLSEEEITIAEAALHSFYLAQYIQERGEDRRPKHSSFSFSGKTKCEAAEYKRKLLLGLSPEPSLGFFKKIVVNLALNQGRLKNVGSVFEDSKSMIEARQSGF